MSAWRILWLNCWVAVTVFYRRPCARRSCPSWRYRLLRRLTDVARAAAANFDGHAVTASWGDYDNDGAFDLALANNDAQGGHYLFRNRLADDRAHASLAVDVVDARGRHTKPGAEVRVYAGGGRLIASALVDAGSGYCSQNVMPVHLGVAGETKVDVEATVLTRSGRRTVARKHIDPRTAARPLVISAPE